MTRWPRFVPLLKVSLLAFALLAAGNHGMAQTVARCGSGWLETQPYHAFQLSELLARKPDPAARESPLVKPAAKPAVAR